MLNQKLSLRNQFKTLRTTKGSDIVVAYLEKRHNFQHHVALVWAEIPTTIFITVAWICDMMLSIASTTIHGNTHL